MLKEMRSHSRAMLITETGNILDIFDNITSILFKENMGRCGY